MSVIMTTVVAIALIMVFALSSDFTEHLAQNRSVRETMETARKKSEVRIVDLDPVVKDRRDKIKEMMLHAWNGYKKYAWGANELSPLSKKPYHGGVFGQNDIGLTIIDAVDTLYIMGLTKEYEEGRKWIQTNFTLDHFEGSVDAFEMTIRVVGGLLSIYALTEDTLYKDKATYVVNKLLPIFDTPTGIPKALIDLRTNETKNHPWTYGDSSILSQFGSLHLELEYMTEITGLTLYKNHTQHIRNVLLNSQKPYGLYPIYMNPDNAEWGLHYISMGSYGDSFYEYLLKSWIQTGFKDEVSKKMFRNATDSIIKRLVGKSFEGLTYLGTLKFGELEPKMDHLACFAPGLFALAGHVLRDQQEYTNLAENLIKTCHQSYINAATGLSPEFLWFVDPLNDASASKIEESRFALRPETVESYFYLWRFTKNTKYRDWGWDFVLSLEKYCRTPDGFTGIKNVYDVDTEHDDIQQSYFLAETLKYLYLLYSNDDLASLDQWVFNTEGHPLPIKGT